MSGDTQDKTTLPKEVVEVWRIFSSGKKDDGHVKVRVPVTILWF